MRVAAREDCHFILSLYDHLLTMVSDKDIPLADKNFTFEICMLHTQLMELFYGTFILNFRLQPVIVIFSERQCEDIWLPSSIDMAEAYGSYHCPTRCW